MLGPAFAFKMSQNICRSLLHGIKYCTTIQVNEAISLVLVRALLEYR